MLSFDAVNLDLAVTLESVARRLSSAEYTVMFAYVECEATMTATGGYCILTESPMAGEWNVEI
jgi:hypothetical protein